MRPDHADIPLGKSISSRLLPINRLSSIIDCYIFRTIDIDDGKVICKYMPCRHTNSIDFFIGDVYDTFNLATNKLQPFIRSTIRGPRTFKKNSICIKGAFKSFSIRFKPNGIYQLLRIPMEDFKDQAIDATLIYPCLFQDLTERLMECNDIQACVKVAEPYLINLISDKKFINPAASWLADNIKDSNGSATIKTLYNQLALNPRQIERNFIKEVGVSPKAFASLIRFESMIKIKIDKPSQKWVELAYEFKYYDQMHMIKDFQKYLNIKPSNFDSSIFAF